jgi:hypothetical protein
MIYSNILNPKFRNLLRGFVLVLVAIFSLSLYSCETTSIETYTPEQLRVDTVNDGAKVLEVTTKTDSIINLEDYDAKYYRQFDKVTDAILLKNTSEKLTANDSQKGNKSKNNLSKISLQDILYAKVEKHEIDVPLTVLAITGVAVTAITAIIILISIAFSSMNFKIVLPKD